MVYVYTSYFLFVCLQILKLKKTIHNVYIKPRQNLLKILKLALEILKYKLKSKRRKLGKIYNKLKITLDILVFAMKNKN